MKLEISDVTKSFPGVRALDQVSMTIYPGEIHALLGENGAGKSTLIKVITGVEHPDAGETLIDGEAVSFRSPREASDHGIGVVHQERNLIPRFTVGENIMLENLPHRGPFVDYDAVHKEASRWLQLLGVGVASTAPVERLSVAQLQLVEIAKALSSQSRILLLDEPTASITPHETDVLFEVLRRLRDDGVGLVFVSHKLEEVFALCDRVTVLRDGHNSGTDELLEELDEDAVVTKMIGRTVEQSRPPERDASAQPVTFEVRNLSTSAGHRDISFKIRRGELYGLYGLVGAGRTELARALSGIEDITGGEMRRDGEPVRASSVAEALRHGIGYVSEDRKQEGLVLAHSVQRNVAVTVWHRIRSLFGYIRAEDERRTVEPFIHRLNVRTPSYHQKAQFLSGGNQQKLSVAKWLAAQADVLIIDEPTVGIDVQTKANLHQLMWELAEDGLSILLISSDMTEMVKLADRIGVMKEFRLLGEFGNTHDYEEMSSRIMQLIQQVEEQEVVSAPSSAW